MPDKPSVLKSFTVLHGDDLVVDLGVEGVRDESGTDSLDLVGTGLAFGEEG